MKSYRVGRGNILYTFPNRQLFTKWVRQEAYIDGIGRLIDLKSSRSLGELKTHRVKRSAFQKCVSQTSHFLKTSPMVKHFVRTIENETMRVVDPLLDEAVDQFFCEVLPNVWVSVFVPIFHSQREKVPGKQPDKREPVEKERGDDPEPVKIDRPLVASDVCEVSADAEREEPAVPQEPETPAVSEEPEEPEPPESPTDHRLVNKRSGSRRGRRVEKAIKETSGKAEQHEKSAKSRKSEKHAGPEEQEKKNDSDGRAGRRTSRIVSGRKKTGTGRHAAKDAGYGQEMDRWLDLFESLTGPDNAGVAGRDEAVASLISPEQLQKINDSIETDPGMLGINQYLRARNLLGRDLFDADNKFVPIRADEILAEVTEPADGE